MKNSKRLGRSRCHNGKRADHENHCDDKSLSIIHFFSHSEIATKVGLETEFSD